MELINSIDHDLASSLQISYGIERESQNEKSLITD